MSFVLCYRMLGSIELEILATVERGDAISDIAAKLDYSENYVSCAVADLSEKGVGLYGTGWPSKAGHPLKRPRCRDLSRPHPPVFPHRLSRAVDREDPRGHRVSSAWSAMPSSADERLQRASMAPS